MLMATIIQQFQAANLAKKIMAETTEDSSGLFDEIVEHMTYDHPLKESSTKDDASKASIKSSVIRVIDELFQNAEFPSENGEDLRAQ